VISRRVRYQLAAFGLLALVFLTVTASQFVGVGKLVNHPYTVKADFVGSGGIFTNAEVTYRGVSVGRVGPLHLTKNGVQVDLEIDKGKQIPADTRAVVADLSAVGEQYVDLQPRTDSGPYLRGGDVIPQSATEIPIDDNTVLVNLDKLVNSVDRNQLRSVVNELGTAFAGSGRDLSDIVDASTQVLNAFRSNLPQIESLIEDGTVVLNAARDTKSAFLDWNASLRDLTTTIRQSDPDLRRLLDNGVTSSQQFSALLQDIRPSLPILLGNVVTVNQIQGARLPGLDILLTTYPQVVAASFHVLKDPAGGARFGLVTDQNAPICTKGYKDLTTATRNDKPENADLSVGCTEPVNGKDDVRGSRNAPRPPGDNTDPALQGGAAYTGQSSRAADAAAYDPSTGLITGPDGEQMLLGTTGGEQKALGSDSWKYLLLGPLGS
jgi:phospholipid/cholesterol/gamma-HCH transport system substrate-binding protein